MESKNYKQHLHIVEYDKLVLKPQKVLEGVYKFLGLQEFKEHHFDDIKNYCHEEKDAAWGLKTYTKLEKNLKKQAAIQEKFLEVISLIIITNSIW
jgi:hypothetical protein